MKSAPLRTTSSTAILTPSGETCTTFRGTNSTVTLLPDGQVIYTVKQR